MSHVPVRPASTAGAGAQPEPAEPLVGEGELEFEDAPLLERPHPSPPDRGHSGFVGRVASIFATRVVTLVLSLFTSVLLSKLLGVQLRGEYSAVLYLPGLLTAFALLGLPSAVNYFAGRGYRVSSLIRASLIFLVAICVPLIAIVWFLLPVLEQSILKGARDDLLRVILLSMPLGMLAAFGGTILYGRQRVGVYNLILILQSVVSLLGAVVLVGALHLKVEGAIATSVIVNAVLAFGVMFEVARLERADRSGEAAPMRGILAYAARVYPASVTGYFNARADVFLIQGLAATKNIADDMVALYGWAVTMAEIVFYVPESVASMFLPRVASTTPEQANAMLGRFSRMTILVTVVFAVLLIPPAYIGIHVVLPAFTDCLPAFFAILPGVVSLSVAKVMTSYLGGRGKPGPISVAASISLASNVVANLILIPIFGIVGASLSSVVSYTVLAVIVVRMASRMSGQPIRSLIFPTRAEVALLVDGSRRMTRRARRVGRP